MNIINKKIGFFLLLCCSFYISVEASNPNSGKFVYKNSVRVSSIEDFGVNKGGW